MPPARRRHVRHVVRCREDVFAELDADHAVQLAVVRPLGHPADELGNAARRPVEDKGVPGFQVRHLPVDDQAPLAERLRVARQIPLAELAEATSHNFFTLFKLAKK